MCSEARSAHSNADFAVTASDMVEMAEMVVGTGASCMVPVPGG